MFYSSNALDSLYANLLEDMGFFWNKYENLPLSFNPVRSIKSTYKLQ